MVNNNFDLGNWEMFEHVVKNLEDYEDCEDSGWGKLGPS